jgi:hypothetical protein
MRWPAKVTAAVQDRSGFVCEGCGQRPATNIHHRKYASRQGKSEVVNALHVCGMGNVLGAGCHGVAHSAEGHELGWSVHSWDDPALVPVLYRGVMSWLTPDGRVVDVKPDPIF